jgi:hypothetical protein
MLYAACAEAHVKLAPPPPYGKTARRFFTQWLVGFSRPELGDRCAPASPREYYKSSGGAHDCLMRSKFRRTAVICRFYKAADQWHLYCSLGRNPR